MECIFTMNFLLVLWWFRSCVKGRMGTLEDSEFSSFWISSSELCHCCIPEIPNASSSLLLPQKRERDNHSWTARTLEQEDLRSSEHLCPYKQDGSDVFAYKNSFIVQRMKPAKHCRSEIPNDLNPKVWNGSAWHLRNQSDSFIPDKAWVFCVDFCFG